MTTEEKLVQVFKQLNTMQSVVTKSMVMISKLKDSISDLRLINIEMQKRFDKLEKNQVWATPKLTVNGSANGIAGFNDKSFMVSNTNIKPTSLG